MTSSVPPDDHGVGVLLPVHRPKADWVRFGRRMPIAWNGPVIHRSM